MKDFDSWLSASALCAATAPSYAHTSGHLIAGNIIPNIVNHIMADGYDVKKNRSTAVSTSPVLPAIKMVSLEADTGRSITMTLQPEENLTAHSALKLMMLMMAYEMEGHRFSAYEYVKANNLERHFKFE